MKLGIIIDTNNPEKVFNAFSLGISFLKANHEVKIFLVNGDSAIRENYNSKYDVKGIVKKFQSEKGKMNACALCEVDDEKIELSCKSKTMDGVRRLIEECDKIIPFY
jgi:peroxiredoxin family protein